MGRCDPEGTQRVDSANSFFIKKDEEPPVYFIPSLFQVSLSEPKEIRLAIKSLFSEAQNMDVYLPAAISLYRNPPGFPVLRSENIQLPEDESSGSCILPGLPSKYFRPHLVNRRRFQPACCFTAGKSDARRNLLQPVTEFTSVQRMQTKLTPIFSNGCI